MNRSALAAALCVTLAVAGCGGDDPVVQQNFAPLQYGYLTKLRLNVGTIEIRDATAPQGSDDIAAQSPVPPAQAARQMGRDRLFAAGAAGSAIFTVEQASISRGPGGTLSGQVAVRLDILTQTGARGGYAEARVERQHTPGSDENEPAELYAMSKQMLADLNVELEYQVKASLKDWLVSPYAAPSPVQAQPLAPVGPPAAPVQAPAPPSPAYTRPLNGTPAYGAPSYPAPNAAPDFGAPPPEGSPPSNYPPTEEIPPPEPPQMSPPPGYLRLPGSQN